MTREIDTRQIPGNGGTVTWLLDGEGHLIVVCAYDGTIAGSVRFDDGLAAREAFQHPFALQDVVDVFTTKTVEAVA